MCLLVDQSAESNFTYEFLAGVYRKNSDGLGIMYAEDGEVKVFKHLPKSVDDFINFYDQHAKGRDCIWHARMKTHGDIDMENCHPYKVTDEIYMAHNGILSAGNDPDEAKSDTWHFINWVLRPALLADPTLLHNHGFQDYIAHMIGSSNKFAFMTAQGDSVVMNVKSGVNFEKSWLSNTYAWDYYKLTNTPSPASYKPTTRSYSDWGYEDGLTYDPYGHHTKALDWESPSEKKKEVSEATLKKSSKALVNSYLSSGERGVLSWVKDAPYKALDVWHAFYRSAYGDDEDMIIEFPEQYAADLIEIIETDSITPSWIDA